MSNHSSTPSRTNPAQPITDPKTPEQIWQEVRARAYEIWEQEGKPQGRDGEHWAQAEHEISHSGDAIEGDDVPNLGALREAAREHNDAFVVASDLEDADQREASPGTREQP
ncbi:DUF2934 domain-containing protein [Rhizobium sp. S152]|uniref:DUF2934 domain-containing protein n=1 Tax=Rhizobium sp. S152 TaxID=3055038 RepID=UPI0025A9A55B|nr:DUF2934 domain-containing protein [Rhizobium sp. S152]MDM9625338.1 DUF2934 domain-containing protein [Rhizobium sp. S152]